MDGKKERGRVMAREEERKGNVERRKREGEMKGNREREREREE
jgi:hypothetical protein